MTSYTCRVEICRAPDTATVRRCTIRTHGESPLMRKAPNLVLGILAIATGCLLLVGSLRAESYEIRNKGTEAWVQIDVVPFVLENHSVTWSGVDSDRYVSAIDGSDYSGSDGDLPRFEIDSLRVFTPAACHRVGGTAFSSLYNPHVTSKDFEAGWKVLKLSERIGAGLRFTQENEKLYLTWDGGDGAGSYAVLWELDLSDLKIVRHLSEWPDPDEVQVRRFDLLPCSQRGSEKEEDP